MIIMDGLHQMHPTPFPQQSHPMPTPITSSMNRSQRCGVCRGCQCKPCGQCTYCQDSPQFGGPGVKKQSCIERRCLRVLENRLQRDAPTFKARVGCNNCEDCRMPDCHICLVCLDKRFFENRYMTGAMCAKKRCNNATSIELPAASPQNMHEYQQRQAQKRAYEQSGPPMHFDMKRQAMGYGAPMQMHPQMQMHRQILVPTQPPTSYELGMPLRVPAGPGMQQQQPQMQQMQQQQQHTSPTSLAQTTSISPATSVSNPTSMAQSTQQVQTQQAPPPQLMAPPLIEAPYILSYGGPQSPSQLDYFASKQAYFVEEIQPNGDPFLPPSYAPDMKNAVVLQPL